MPGSGYVLAIDQGTSATKAVLVAADGSVAAVGSAPVAQAFPAPGWVDQDPADIWASVQSAVAACLESGPTGAGAEVVAVGLSTQRESAVLWERATGKPLAPLVSWQDRRTADRARALLDAGHGDAVLAATGLPIDPMFSALKFGWLLDHFDRDRGRSGAGELCLGTVDAWLLAQFAEPGTEPVVEVGNASRTQLLDLRTGRWDARLLDLFGVPAATMPRVVGSTGPFPATRGLAPLPDGTPVLAVFGDSHGALFAHAGWRPGVVKATYGTGSSVMALGTPRGAAVEGVPAGGVCATIAWQVDGPAPALEANIRSTGRTLTWLADLFGTDVATLLAEAGTTAADGVTLVPAFGGLGAPWWDAAATPVLSGFSLGTTRANIARAALESVAFQVADVVAATAEVGGPVTALVVDGGPSRSDLLMQLQADVSGVPVHRPAAAELSALGAANLAGLGAGLWTWAELEERGSAATEVFRPRWPADERAARVAEWRRGVDRARGSTAPPPSPEPADLPTPGSTR